MTIQVPTIFPRCVSFCLLAALVALAAGCGATEAPEPVDAVNRPAVTAGPETGATVIVFLGDSISAGAGVAADDSFPAVVEDRLREEGYAVDVKNAGVSGDTTAGGLSRLDWVLRSEPDILVVELGGNDALRGQPLENIEKNLREIVRRGGEAGARVLLLGMDVPSNYGPDYTGGFSGLYERIAAEENVAVVPGFIREVGLDPALMQADGIHPTVEGHRILAESLVPALSGMLDEVDR